MSTYKINESVTPSELSTVNDFYQYVQKAGLLRSSGHAHRWVVGTLQVLGVNLSGKVKKQLYKALPEELATHLKGIFWPVFFRNTNISVEEFSTRVARRSRATSDPDFARHPIEAVFGALKEMIDDDLSRTIRDDLAPEISQIWDRA